jgi:hypothetical protein
MQRTQFAASGEHPENVVQPTRFPLQDPCATLYKVVAVGLTSPLIASSRCACLLRSAIETENAATLIWIDRSIDFDRSIDLCMYDI